MVDGIHQLAGIAAAANSIDPGSLGEWQLEVKVTGFRNSADYARCLAYLQGLGLVDEVGVAHAGPDGIVFNLSLNAAPEFLGRYIEQDRVLESLEFDNEYQLLP